MIIKEVVTTSEFRRNFNDLDSSVKDKVKKILRSLQYGEKVGGVFHVPLKGDLVGYTSVHFDDNSHRLIYRITKNKAKIVGPRNDSGDIYERLRKLKNARKL